MTGKVLVAGHAVIKTSVNTSFIRLYKESEKIGHSATNMTSMSRVFCMALVDAPVGADATYKMTLGAQSGATATWQAYSHAELTAIDV